MSLFNRKLYKQRPQAWGPVSSVQASIFKNAEKIGIDPKTIKRVWPFWEASGTFTEIISLVKSEYAPNSWNTGAALFNKNDSTYGINSGVQQPLGTNFSILLVMAPILESAPNGAYLSAGSTANGEFMLRRNVDVYGSYNFYANAGACSLIATTNDNSGTIVPIVIDRDSVDLRVFIANKYFGRDTGPGGTFTTSKQIQFGGADSLSTRAGSCRIYFCVILEGTTISKSYSNYGLVPLFSDNPYYLLHRVAPVFYSVPGGGVLPTFNPLFLNAAQPTRVIQ